jgi:hypothetical protein
MVELQKAVASQGNVIGSTLQTVTKCSASGRWVEKETKIETQSADWISSHVLSHFLCTATGFHTPFTIFF